jgi:beta-fructofuranosidase
MGTLGLVRPRNPSINETPLAFRSSAMTPETDLTAPFSVAKLTKIYDPSIGENERWYINDHSFIRGDDGTWHLFGITHQEPFAPFEEKFFAHATAPTLRGPWTKQAPVMHFDPACGETHVWAPHVIKAEGKYWMFYCGGGRDHTRYRIHLATSSDLWTFERHPANPMVIDGYEARDPMILRHRDRWHIYYTATSTRFGGHHTVARVSSDDLLHWSEKTEVFRHSKVGDMAGPTESPFVVPRSGKFYLFIGPAGGYRKTAVYVSDTPDHWSEKDLVTVIPSHAAEVIEDSGKWFVSSCGWGSGGVFLADLTWRD